MKNITGNLYLFFLFLVGFIAFVFGRISEEYLIPILKKNVGYTRKNY